MSSENYVRIIMAENLRFPEEGSSAQGKPSGDPDGKQVNIPVLIITAMQRRRGDTAAY